MREGSEQREIELPISESGSKLPKLNTTRIKLTIVKIIIKRYVRWRKNISKECSQQVIKEMVSETGQLFYNPIDIANQFNYCYTNVARNLAEKISSPTVRPPEVDEYLH